MGSENLLYRPNDEIREVQNDCLRKQMALLAEASPHYKKLFAENKIDVSKIKTVDDLANLPVTTKKDYIKDPESFRLVHKDPNVFDTIWRVIYTAGTTTGKPAPFYYTTYDYYATLLHGKRTAEIKGLTPRDLTVNLCPLTSVPHSAYHTTIDQHMAIGTPIVSALTGAPFPKFPVHNSSDHAVAMIESYRATSLSGMPSFIRRLFLRAVEEKRDYSSLRLVAVFGEPCHRGMRDNLHELMRKLGAQNVFICNSLGSTETCGALGVECREMGGMHCPAPDLYYVEILDPATYKPLPEGEVGLVCFTHLDRRGTALLRFVTGDMMSISNEPCPHCGRTGIRLMGEPFRASEIVKLKSTLVNPDILISVLAGIAGIEEYKIVFTKEDLSDPYSLDQLKIQASLKGGFSREDLNREITGKIRDAVEVTPRVEFLSSTEIYDPSKSMKAVRVVDERPRS